MKLFAFAAAAAAALLVATAAHAGEQVRAPNAEAAARDAAAREATKAERVVYVCDRSDMTLRGFAREFGEARFVSAEEALNTRESWSAPRCMTETEATKLSALTAR